MAKLYDAEWTVETIQERRINVARSCRMLSSLLERPPGDWMPARWYAMEDRLRSWEGQIAALDWHLERLTRKATAEYRQSASGGSGW